MLHFLNIDSLVHVLFDFSWEILTALELCKLSILSCIMHHHFSFLGSYSILLLELHIVELLDSLVFFLVSHLFLPKSLFFHHDMEFSLIDKLRTNQSLFLFRAKNLSAAMIWDFLLEYLANYDSLTWSLSYLILRALYSFSNCWS